MSNQRGPLSHPPKAPIWQHLCTPSGVPILPTQFPVQAQSNLIRSPSQASIMSLATKAQSQKIFEKLKSKPANKVSCPSDLEVHQLTPPRSALIAEQRIPLGLLYRSASTSVLIARPSTVTWEYTSLSSALPISIVSLSVDKEMLAVL